MTPEAAIYGFMSGFGIPAYAATSVPDDAEFPYLTYDLATGDFIDGEVSITVNLWYRGDSEAEPNAKAREIAERITSGGRIIAFTGGAVWIKKGSPFCQSMGDTADDKIKRRYINLNLEYIALY